MARDKLSEIAAVRGRAHVYPQRGQYAIEELRKRWLTHGEESFPPEYVVIRLVTALEVFTRDWVKEIIDSGNLYIERATELVKGSLKIDFAIAQALVGKTVTFGDLVAHEIPINSIGDISRVFDTLIGASVFSELVGLVDDLDQEPKTPPAPIINDINWTRARLADLFTFRHIVVHELPASNEISSCMITDFAEAADNFCLAAATRFAHLLGHSRATTQLEMNFEAAERAQVAQKELDAVLVRLDPDGSDVALQKSQEAWENYKSRQAEYRSNINSQTRGSIAPLLYSAEVEKLTISRTEELMWFLNREDGDM